MIISGVTKKTSLADRPFSPGGRLTTAVSSRSRSLSDKDDSYSSTELPEINHRNLNGHIDHEGDGSGKDDRMNNLSSPAPSPTHSQDKHTQNKQWIPNLPGKLSDRNASSSQSTVSSGRRSAVLGLNARNTRIASPRERAEQERREDRHPAPLEERREEKHPPPLERVAHIDRSPTLERRNSRSQNRQGGKSNMMVDRNQYDKFARRGGRASANHERKPSPNRRLINLAYPEAKTANRHASPTRVSPRLKRRGSMEPREPLDPSILSVNGEKTDVRVNEIRPGTRMINRRGSFDYQGMAYKRAHTTLDDKVIDIPPDRRSPLPIADRSSHSVNNNNSRVALLPAISPPLVGARKILEG